MSGKTLGGTTEQGGSYVDLKVWFGDLEKPEEGLTVESENIDFFALTANMFTMLPTLTLQVVDTGRFFSTYSVKIGDTLNVIAKPSKIDGDEDREPEPFIKGSFVVQIIQDYPSTNKPGSFIHKYICTYAAQRYITELAVYPTYGLTTFPLYRKVTSTDVLREIIEASGLGFSDDTDIGEIDDKSYWVCANETRSAFCDRVVRHAWAGLGNAPILFTDAKGIAHYMTIKDICKASGDKLKQDVDYCSGKVAESRGDDRIIRYDDAAMVNGGGPVLNHGGYSLNASLYNPYNKDTIPYKEAGMIGKLLGMDPPYLPVYTGSKFAQIGAAATALMNGGFDKYDRGDGHRNVTWKNDTQRLATVKNASPGMAEVITKAENGGMHFDEMHDYYTVADGHNEQVRRSFFQNFITLNVDANRQGEAFYKDYNRPQLGDTINVDFSNSETVDPIHSGRYCIVQIRYVYANKKPFTEEVVCANDGLYGVRGQ